MHAIVGAMFIAITYNWMILLGLLVKMTTFYLLMAFGRRSLLWAYACLWLVILDLAKTQLDRGQIQTWTRLNADQNVNVINVFAWGILKSLSVTLDNLRSMEGGGGGGGAEKKVTIGLSTFCGYIFYFPTLVHGPVLIFSRYDEMLKDRCLRSEPIAHRCWRLARNLLRFGALILLSDFGLHYIYLAHLQYNIKVDAIFFFPQTIKFHFNKINYFHSF